MTLATLLNLGVPKEIFLKELDKLNLNKEYKIEINDKFEPFHRKLLRLIRRLRILVLIIPLRNVPKVCSILLIGAVRSGVGLLLFVSVLRRSRLY